MINIWQKWGWALIEVILYSREGCHLCEDVKVQLENLRDSLPHNLIELDIEQNDKLHRLYWDKIPVLEIGPYKLSAPIEPASLEMTLRAASDRVKQMQGTEAKRQELISARRLRLTRTDRFSYWLTNHYMAVFNLFVLLYLGLPFLAPILMKAELPRPAGWIYTVYRSACHQLAYRSVFLFGEQLVYPARAAGLDNLAPYEDVSGAEPFDLVTARDFIGSSALGYKVAICQRDIAIWLGVFLFGMAFSLTGRKLRPLPLGFWILVGMFPIGIDGVSQLISQLPYEWLNSVIPYRESTPLLRSVTGLLFGITTAWFGYPSAELAMADTRRILLPLFESGADHN